MALDFRAMLSAERAKRKGAREDNSSNKSSSASTCAERYAHDHFSIEYSLPSRNTRPLLNTAHRIDTPLNSVFHVPDWLDEAEEQALLSCVGNSADDSWVQLRGRRLQQHGGTPMPDGMRPEPLPDWISSVVDALMQTGIFTNSTRPNHALVNEYLPGQGIDAHRDGPLYYSRVAIVSMGSHCSFQFLSDDVTRRPELSIILPRRGLLVFEADAYEKFLHTVPACHVDEPTSDTYRLDLLTSTDDSPLKDEDTRRVPVRTVERPESQDSCPIVTDKEQLPRGKRVSLTIRHVLKVGAFTEEIVPLTLKQEG